MLRTIVMPLTARGKSCEEDPLAPPLDTEDIRAVGLTLSTLEVNGHPNPFHVPGRFKLEIDAVSAACEPQPSIVMVGVYTFRV